MPRRILYLSYYFEPDLGAGSFRNSSLVQKLQNQIQNDEEIYVIASTPNRYHKTEILAPLYEERGNIKIYRINVPQHSNGFIRQVISFMYYTVGIYKIVKNQKFDLVFASTSKLMTAYIAYRIAKPNKIPLFLDVRDLFAENLMELIKIQPLAKPLSYFVKYFFEKPSFRYAAHINVNSEGFIPSLNYLNKTSISFYPNGIDDFFKGQSQNPDLPNFPKVICYAGNIGEAQGLDLIVPELALNLGDSFQFKIIGDGSAIHKLKNKIEELNIQNVQVLEPVARIKLLEHYSNCHYLFIHLNDYKALNKVLPSKLFEYACFNVPIIAGVSGYAKEFMENHVKENIYFFLPCNLSEALECFKYEYKSNIEREDFINKFDRNNISEQLATLILNIFRKI
ncbi:MAG: glycosyltransferase family 4 protein [Saprospiraceae bacterium]|nr:glycosyltransferase family 4 protein [Saprospiraceae bacterium]